MPSISCDIIQRPNGCLLRTLDDQAARIAAGKRDHSREWSTTEEVASPVLSSRLPGGASL